MPSMKKAQDKNYQSRVGALRREKTRNRLIETALAVFAEKGPDAVIIDDFIAAAHIARGTFYNYFRTTNDLLAAVVGEASDEVLRVIDPIAQQQADPAQRVIVGSRLYIAIAVRYPLWGAFIIRTGAQRGARGQLLDKYLARDLQAAMDTGRFKVGNIAVARNIALGSIMYGIETLLSEQAPDDYVEQAMFSLLRAFGIGAREARKMASAPIAECPALTGTVFRQSQDRGQA